jgi:rhamnosyltransferase
MVALNKAGEMNEALFIDNIDLEWSFRASVRGVALRGVPSAQLAHAIGDKVFGFWGRQIYLHSPTRQYYIMRNRLLLYAMPHVPLAWKLQDAWRAVIKVVLFTTVFAPRLNNLRMMALGAWHALRGRSGSLEHARR